MADEKTFRLRIITPDRVFFEGEAYMVELTTTEGDVGIYADHVPTTLILSPGILRIHQNGEEKKAALHAGFIEVLKTQVTVLAEACEWPGEIDVERAKEAMERAQKRLQSNEKGVDVLRAEMALRRSMARMRAVK